MLAVVEKEIDKKEEVDPPEDPLNESTEKEHDPHYDPIISLPLVVIPSCEEDEVELFKSRAKLFRYDTKETPSEWKERGTGVVKILSHKNNNTVRVVMRRDKTLKLCANHWITPSMELKLSSSCDRAWIYSVSNDFSDNEPKSELFAIKFANTDIAHKWKETFEEAQKSIADETNELSDEEEDDKVSGDSNKLSPEDNKEISAVEDKEVSEKLSELSVTEKISEITE